MAIKRADMPYNSFAQVWNIGQEEEKEFGRPAGATILCNGQWRRRPKCEISLADGLFVVHRNVQFVVREHEARLAKFLIDSVVHVASHCPIVAALAPTAGGNGHAAFAQFGQSLPGSGDRFASDRLLKDERTARLDVGNSLAYLVVVRAVGEVEVDINAAVGLGRNVLH